MRGNLPRCSRTGTQENEGKIWNTWLVIVVSVYWLGLNEEIMSLRNTECVMHRPGEEAPLTLLCSQIALHYVRLWTCIYRLLHDAMRTRKVRITVVVPLGFVHPSVTTCDMTERKFMTTRQTENCQCWSAASGARSGIWMEAVTCGFWVLPGAGVSFGANKCGCL